MALQDVLSNLKGYFKRNDAPQVRADLEYGSVGTALFKGIIAEEFNPDLDGQNAIEAFDQMRKTDGTIIALLEAVKGPILSAKHFIREGGPTPKDKKLAEFTRIALFEKLENGYNNFAREAFTFPDFGFSLFEKVYTVSPDGYIYWKRFAPRIQSSIYKWEIEGQPKWINGHPSGITQQLPGKTDDVKTEETQPSIPWNKLIHFAFRQEGNNFQGVSMLRAAYKHWLYKDVLYKVQGISAERFGVGIPVAKHPSSLGDSEKAKLEQLLKNMRSNEQGFARYDNSIELDILTPKGDAKAASIAEAIAHHDRKIYDSVLAGFLNLTTGEGGSNALSKDQSSFFMRVLRQLADYYTGVMNRHIRELIDLNFQNVENYPTLEITEIGQTSLDEVFNSIAVAVDRGMIMPTSQDEVVIREMLGLPERTVKEIDKDKQKKEEMQQAQQEQAKKEEEAEEAPKEKEEGEDIKEEVKKQGEAIGRIEEMLLTFQESKKKRTPTERERAFIANITEFEAFLESEYKKFEEVVVQAEKKYTKVLNTIYDAADVERIDGVEVFTWTPTNKKLIKTAESAINAVTKQLEDRLVNSGMQDRLFNKAKQMAVNTFATNDKLLAEIEVDPGKFNSFVSGYVSNVKGVLFNEPRRIMENVVLNFGSESSKKLAKEQAEAIAFNKNILKLSVVTHPRAAYSDILTTNAVKSGFSFFKVVVPKNKLADLSPSGTTSGLLYKILTLAMLNKMMSKDSEGKNSNAAKGLGLHHGSFEYLYPIESDMLDEEEELAAQQRKDFEESQQ